MSRKTSSFGQLIQYMNSTTQNQYDIYRNLYELRKEQIKIEFENNAKYIKRRKNGIYMYHEILSIKKTDNIPIQRQKEILKQITQEYLSNRAKNNLSYGVLHDDKTNNLHYHLMISSNERDRSKKTRITKAKFKQIKINLEKKLLRQYPELNQTQVMNNIPKKKISNKGTELKRRTGKTPHRTYTKETIQNIFQYSQDRQDFLSRMNKGGLKLYNRGNTFGVIEINTGRKYRLNRLGILGDFNIMQENMKMNKEKVKTKVDKVQEAKRTLTKDMHTIKSKQKQQRY